MQRLIKTSMLISIFISAIAVGEVFQGRLTEWCDGTKWMSRENGKTTMIDDCARTGEICVELKDGSAECREVKM